MTHSEKKLSQEELGKLFGSGTIFFGVEPSPYRVAWIDSYERLRTYKAREGHCSVPDSYKTDSGHALGIWCNTQRKQYKAGNLSDEWIKKLEDLGFVWFEINESVDTPYNSSDLKDEAKADKSYNEQSKAEKRTADCIQNGLVFRTNSIDCSLTNVDGEYINLWEWCGLSELSFDIERYEELCAEEHYFFLKRCEWDEQSGKSFCDFVVTEEIDEIPGHSCVYYEVTTDNVEELKQKLRETIIRLAPLDEDIE